MGAAVTGTYEYKVRDRTGRLVSGKLDAGSEAQVVAKLRGMGYAPVRVKRSGTGLSKEITVPGLGQKVGLKDLAVMTRQLATMIDSGLSLMRALTILSEQTENKALVKVLVEIRQDVEGGAALSAALAKHPAVFPPLLVNMCKAGEVGGFLDAVLLQVAAHLTTGNATACTSAGGVSGAGCGHSGASRALGDVVLGGLPAVGLDGLLTVTAPLGYTGSWKVTGLTETAFAESGTGARAPGYTRSGTLSWWNGTGYSQVALDSDQRQEVAPAPVTARFASLDQTLEITVESTVTVEPATVTTEGPSGCATSSCVALARAAGGIRGLTTYTVALDGVVQTRFVVITELGGLVAQAGYKAAPDA